MSFNLIGLTGKAGSGKDSLAIRLSSWYAYERVAFATPLKSAVCAMFGIAMHKLEDRDFKEAPIDGLGKSPRELMQLLGTEWGRNMVHPNLWLLLAQRKIDAALTERPVVVTDVRFENEARMIRAMGGTIVHIIRPNVQEVAAHVSEAGVLNLPQDLVVRNDSTLDKLYNETSWVHHKVRELNHGTDYIPTDSHTST